MSEKGQPKRILVLGAGKTGTAVARYFRGKGVEVLVSDRDPQRLPVVARETGAVPCLEEEAEQWLTRVDCVIPSPGVPRTHRLLLAAQRHGVTIRSEIDVAYEALGKPILAVTGTNGKSTTTTVLGSMVAAAGRTVFVGGNLGTPLIEACTQGCELAVAEISSFQLEWAEKFRPEVGVFLNLSPDHLDRYQDLDDYGTTKLRLFARQTERDWAVLNRDDPWLQARLDQITGGQRVTFGQHECALGAWCERDTIFLRLPETSGVQRFALANTRLRGAHNRENLMAAALAAALFGIPEAAIQKAIDEAAPLPHRVEFVRQWRGIEFYDDSKGTNIGAVAKAVAGFDRPVVLLAGGYDKGTRFDPLTSVLRSHVRLAVFFGATAGKWAEQVGGAVAHKVVASLKEAVQIAAREAQPGEVVLLSPGCASFDEFEDYAHRGRCFREWVEAL